MELLEQGAAFAQAGAAPGTPEPIDAGRRAASCTTSFLDGMHLGFRCSTAVAVLAALLALFVKAGRKTEGARSTWADALPPVRP